MQQIGELIDRASTHDHWREGLEHAAEQACAVYQHHPWVLDFVGGRSPSASEFTYFEQQLDLFDGVRLPEATTIQIIGAVGSYVRGAARCPWRASEDASSRDSRTPPPDPA